MEKFVMMQERNGEFQFQLISANGQILLRSGNYLTKSSCENGIFSVKSNLRDPHKFVRHLMEDGSAYFGLKSINEKMLATSKRYENQTLMLNGIERFKNCAPLANIEDHTAVGLAP